MRLIIPSTLRATRPLAAAAGLALTACTGTIATSTPARSAYQRPANDLLAKLRIENQRKVQGFAALAPGMHELEVRRIMGERPVSPAPNTLEYTAYLRGDADLIFIYTLEFDQGRLRAKHARQIPPPATPPRTEIQMMPG